MGNDTAVPRTGGSRADRDTDERTTAGANHTEQDGIGSSASAEDAESGRAVDGAIHRACSKTYSGAD